MCLLICIRGQDGRLTVAANRDEVYDRPTQPPHVWPAAALPSVGPQGAQRRVLAGRDGRAGGTWLAVNDRGVLAAVTNRPTAGGDDPARSSRGRLPLLAVGHASARDARQFLQLHLSATRYNGFNLLVADAEDAFVIQAPGDRPRFDDVPPGMHVIGNAGFDDCHDVRVRRAFELLNALTIEPAASQASHDEPPTEAGATVHSLMTICRDHKGQERALALCLHRPLAGTVSSTILIVGADRKLQLYLHADGSPCNHEYLRQPDLAQMTK